MAAYQGFNSQTLDIKIFSLNISGLRTKTFFLKQLLIHYEPIFYVSKKQILMMTT